MMIVIKDGQKIGKIDVRVQKVMIVIVRKGTSEEKEDEVSQVQWPLTGILKQTHTGKLEMSGWFLQG